MSTILVTGGKGFLGQHIVQRLRDRGEEVRILARLRDGETPKSEPGVIWGDVRDRQAVEEAVNGVDAVIHLASNFRRGGSDKGEAYAINVEGTQNVVKAAEKFGVQRIVYCSTIGVHGDVKEIPANEETAFNPGDLYQETKMIAEQWIESFYRETGLPITVVRPASVYGPGDQRMLKLFKMIKKRRFIMFGSGEPLFHPAYIDDVVDGCMLCLEKDAAVGQTFILGGGEYMPLKELVRVIAEEMQVPPPRLRFPLAPMLGLAWLTESVCVPLGIEPPLHRRRVSFYENSRAFSVEKARQMLGFEPRVPLREGVRRTIRWYEQQGWL